MVAQWLKSTCQFRGQELDPWSGKISRAVEQLSPSTRTIEIMHLEPMLCNKRSHWNEITHALQPESSPCSPQLEKANWQQWKTQCPRTAKKKNKQINNIKKNHIL